MSESFRRTRLVVLAAAAVAIACRADAQQQSFVQLAGAPCATLPVLHCPEKDCAADRVINQGPVLPALRELPPSDFSFIYETGQREMDEKGLPEASAWAARFGCGPRRTANEITDAQAGYVYDGSRQNPPNPAWGLLPRPGKAQMFVYPGCKDGRIVADIVRLEKGHTEGLEPNVTEALITLMLSANGGKIQRAS